MKTMQELWDEASRYGLVSIYTDSTRLGCQILIRDPISIAKGSGNSPIEALQEAIDEAKEMQIAGDAP